MPGIPLHNTGYIPTRKHTHFLQGSIPYKVILDSGDWRPFVPVGEPQALLQPTPTLETFACVSYSNNNLAEIALKQQGVSANFSDRFLAKVSNTTLQGNSFDLVEAAVQHYGRVNEQIWPIPATLTWSSYYSPIPAQVFAQAQFFSEQFQFISTDSQTLQYWLKMCPIQIAIPVPHPNHAVVLVHIEGTTAYYFDSYPGSTNYLKTIDVSLIDATMALIIKPLTMTKKFIIQDGQKIGTLVLEGYTGVVTFADNPPHLQNLKDAFGFTGLEPTIQVPQ